MTASDYFPELLERLERRQLADPRAALERAALEHPADPRPLVLLAARLIHENDVDRAEAAYLTALQRAPDLAIARFQLGLLQLTSGRPAAAQATWAPLDRLPEADPLRLFKTGLEALAHGDLEQALGWLQEGVAKNASNEPLNLDMRLLIDRISRARGAAQPSGDDSTNSDARFLISNYRAK